MAYPKLNKQLWTDINRLKGLNTETKPKFILDKSPFDTDDQLETGATSKDVVILGRILPDSEIYNVGAYQIEMKLPKYYPVDPPEVRFLTKIYHPNVSMDGSFSNGLLCSGYGWRHEHNLVEVIRIVTKHIDNPDIDFALSLELGYEYMQNKSEFDRKAMEYVKKYALPRF